MFHVKHIIEIEKALEAWKGLKIMGYPNFGKVKTVVLPVPKGGATFAEYKEKYGIDLKEFFELNENHLNLKNVKNTVIYFDLGDVRESAPVEVIGTLLSLTSTIYYTNGYESGVEDAEIQYRIPIYNRDDNIIEFIGYISIVIPNDDELSIDNAQIRYFEI